MHGDSSLRAVTVRLLAQGKTWHAARRRRGSNWQPSGDKSTRSTSWATAAPSDVLEDPSRVGWRCNCVASCCRSTIVIVDGTQVQISAFHSLRNSSAVSNSNRLMNAKWTLWTAFINGSLKDTYKTFTFPTFPSPSLLIKQLELVSNYPTGKFKQESTFRILFHYYEKLLLDWIGHRLHPPPGKLQDHRALIAMEKLAVLFYQTGH